ncbi:MAG: isoaspartyl peptidase/L-asparaginase [Phycisphaerales bacterium]|nr:isoaspartyl peptidase/L-asparaginase [Phycisphaerales bacterium]
MAASWGLAIHGGAGAIPSDLDAQRRSAIEASLATITARAGEALSEGRSSVDVVQQAVEALEEDPHFNAGHGAVLCSDGTHELEAAIMASDGAAGAASLLRTTRHPIALARLVMDTSPHVLIAGEGVEEMGRAGGLEQVENSWFRTPHRAAALQEVLQEHEDGSTHHATVGAVALDTSGDLAAATSTGGMTGKQPGRIGDTPMIGAGTWADRNLAISCTGRGEAFIRHATAAQVAHRVSLLGQSLAAAAQEVLALMPPSSGGLIAVNAEGELVMPFTSAGMYRASLSSTLPLSVGIGPG